VATRSTRGTRAPRRRSRSTRGAPAEAAVALRYIESSALVAALLERDAEAMAALREEGQRVTSALTFAESARAIVRARVSGRLTAAEEGAAIRALRVFERRCTIVAVTDAVLARAGRRFPVEPIRTLDAVHLATAELLGESPQLLTVVTRDVRIHDNACAMGYVVE
jgi:predicted nucleic acid-binding protein